MSWRGHTSRKGAAVAAATALLLAWGASGTSAQVSEKTPFSLVPGSFTMTLASGKTLTSAGEPDYQAGAHADWTFTFDLAHNPAGLTYNDLKDTVINIPAGFMANGNPSAMSTCTSAQLLGKRAGSAECPPDSQVGTISLDLNVAGNGPVLSTFPIYNMQVNSYGVTAELGFQAEILTQVIPITVRPQDSGITSTTPDSQDTGEPHNVTVTIWGVPAAKEHDPERGLSCFERGTPGIAECEGGNEEANTRERPYLANPTNCATMFTATMKADSWEEQQPESWLTAPVGEAGPLSQLFEVGPITGCERIHFDPSLQVQPTTSAVESPSGLDLTMEVPQSWEDPNAFATSTLKDTKVTLPEGYTVNPSAGNGLAGCTPAQYEAETAFSAPGEGCPSESKIGKVTIETPVLGELIQGNVYIAQPYENPFDSLLAMYIVGKAPNRGIIIKAPGKVEPNPVTGQLVTTFDDTPQQPFNRLTLELKQGQTSPLVSPPTCGTYTVDAALTPWSAPEEPRLLSDSFQIEHGIGGGACPSGGTPPFKPTVLAGTNHNAAGSYSPFYLRIIRNDGEQEITKFSTTMPPGLSGNLSGIPFCPEADIQHAREQTGAQAETEPACPAASEIGHTITEAGVGTVLAQTPGKLYLAGPYHGAPLSLVSVTSAKVGPFDLGTVVIRFALFINRITAQVEVSGAQSDPIPHIIDGIVVHVRNIRAYVDRPDFMLNPTSCEPMAVQEAITGTGANIASSADDQTVNVTSRFQAADCASLAFKPSFKVSTSGKTSRRNGAGLHVNVSYPKNALGNDANLRYVKVELPGQLPSRLSTLQKACTAKQFDANPAGCPEDSLVGTAVVHTPILPVPLTGPAYFVSYGGAKFPELVIVLQGYGLTIDVHGETFIHNGVTSSTFRTTPDTPFESFELNLPEGPHSALAANGSLCKVTRTVTVKKRVKVRHRGHVKAITRKVKKQAAGKLLMPTIMIGQNGAEIHQSTVIGVEGCGKRKAAKVRHKRHKKHHRHHK